MRSTLRINVQTYFLTFGNRVKKAEALDIPTVTAIAGVGDHHVVKRPFLRTTARKSNRDHRN